MLGVLLAPEFLALLVHESCGHPTEADRLLEHEVAFAGTTFMWPEDRGKLRYGSAHVSMTADATVPGGLDRRLTVRNPRSPPSPRTGIPGVSGAHWRKVEGVKKYGRGGVLGPGPDG